jgi:hypothetical protein
MIGAEKTEEQTGAEPRHTLGLRHDNGERAALLPTQMSFRWIAFMTASRRLWVRSFWLM